MSTAPGGVSGVVDAALAGSIAGVLIEGFDLHYRLFRLTSVAAKERFEHAAWAEGQRAAQERIRFYDLRVQECVERLRSEFDVETLDAALWRQVKLLYIGLLVEHHQPELAETFFNSVITRILRRTYAQNDLIFVRATMSTEDIESDPPVYRSYYPNGDGLRECFERVFRDFEWAIEFADRARSCSSSRSPRTHMCSRSSRTSSGTGRTRPGRRCGRSSRW
jgi:isocitrate dehydrogenase kinase/phosphatase